jgi:hypothetical protein
MSFQSDRGRPMIAVCRRSASHRLNVHHRNFVHQRWDVRSLDYGNSSSPEALTWRPSSQPHLLELAWHGAAL